MLGCESNKWSVGVKKSNAVGEDLTLAQTTCVKSVDFADSASLEIEKNMIFYLNFLAAGQVSFCPPTLLSLPIANIYNLLPGIFVSITIAARKIKNWSYYKQTKESKFLEFRLPFFSTRQFNLSCACHV